MARQVVRCPSCWAIGSGQPGDRKDCANCNRSVVVEDAYKPSGGLARFNLVDGGVPHD